MLKELSKAGLESMLTTSLWSNDAIEIEGTLIRVGINPYCTGVIAGACNKMIFTLTPATAHLPVEMPGISFCLKDLIAAKRYTGSQFRSFLGFIVAHEVGHIVDFSDRMNRGEDLTNGTPDESFADNYALQTLSVDTNDYNTYLQVIENILKDHLSEAAEGNGLMAKLSMKFIDALNCRTFVRRKNNTLARKGEIVAKDVDVIAEKIKIIVDFLIAQMESAKNKGAV